MWRQYEEGLSYLTELHDNLHFRSLFRKALVVLDHIGVFQQGQHCHLILGLHATHKIT